MVTDLRESVAKNINGMDKSDVMVVQLVESFLKEGMKDASAGVLQRRWLRLTRLYNGGESARDAVRTYSIKNAPRSNVGTSSQYSLMWNNY